MKRIFFFALFSVSLMGLYSCEKEKIKESSKIVDVCFDVNFIERGSMRRTTADDIYQEFYNRHITTKELIVENYNLTLTNEEGIEIAQINGKWDISTIQLPVGKYRITGYSRGDSSTFSSASLQFDETIDIQSSGVITLTAAYDCYL